MSVKVSHVGPLLGSASREHPSGTHWRVSRKGRLMVFDASGREVARYKDDRWVEVWLVEDDPNGGRQQN